MVYTILISIVFIAELIITITIIQNLLRLDKAVLEFNNTITEIQPGIRDVSELARKISEQWQILAEDFVKKTKRNSEDIMLKHLSKIFMSILIVNLNFKIVKKIRKSKVTKILARGWSFLENMV